MKTLAYLLAGMAGWGFSLGLAAAHPSGHARVGASRRRGLLVPGRYLFGRCVRGGRSGHPAAPHDRAPLVALRRRAGLFVVSGHRGGKRPAAARWRACCPAMPRDDDCEAAHPTLGVTCQLPGHPHKRAHHASGSDDGVQWSLFWWRPASVADDPEEKADRPVMRATG